MLYHTVHTDWLIVWCLMQFLTVFQLCCGSQCTYPCFPGALLTSTPHNILPSHWLLSHITTVKSTDSSERGMNLVALTIINPRKEYCRAGDQTSDLLFWSLQCYQLSKGAWHTQSIFSKTLKKKVLENFVEHGELQVTRILTFFHHVFYLFKDKYHNLKNIWTVHCKFPKYGEFFLCGSNLKGSAKRWC